MTTRIELPGTGKVLAITHNMDGGLQTRLLFCNGELIDAVLEIVEKGKLIAIWEWHQNCDPEFSGVLPVGVYLDAQEKY